MLLSNWGVLRLLYGSRVTWVISFVMVIRAIRLLSVVRIAPMFKIILMVLGLSGVEFLDLLVC